MGLVQTSLFDRFNVEAFTMPKYVDIVVDALISKDKLFSLIYFYTSWSTLT